MTHATRNGLTALLSAAALLAAAHHAHAQSGHHANRTYATDTFEGFDAIDNDTRIPQKEKSIWYGVKRPTPAEQLTYATECDTQGKARATRKAYEGLIREWPASLEAAQAQLALAAFHEKQKNYEKAFDEYQYLITHYTGHFPYENVLDRQLRIANHLLHDNTSMFGLALSGTDPIRERFEQIVRNAPRSPRTPEIMLIIAGIRTSENQLPEAITVYDSILNRFPKSPQAVTAAYLAAQCRHELAVKFNYNETRCREAIAFSDAILNRLTNHPQRQQIAAWRGELHNLLVEQNYQQAAFYDTRQHTPQAARAAYTRFLTEFPDSKYAPQVRQRLAQLQTNPAPAK